MTAETDERRRRGVLAADDGDWLQVARFAGPHGVRGDVRLVSFTEDPKAVFSYGDLRDGPGGAPVALRRLRAVKDDFIVHIDGVDSREAATALKGRGLYVARAALEAAADEDEFYLADLIGLAAVDAEGLRVGHVRAVDNFGAGDLIELVLDIPVKGLGRYAFIPFTKVLVPDVDIAGGRVTVDMAAWLAGLQGTDTWEQG